VSYTTSMVGAVAPRCGRDRHATPLTPDQVIASNHTLSYNGRTSIPDRMPVSVLYSNSGAISGKRPSLAGNHLFYPTRNFEIMYDALYTLKVLLLS
jgi:hypothetical protein